MSTKPEQTEAPNKLEIDKESVINMLLPLYLILGQEWKNLDAKSAFQKLQEMFPEKIVLPNEMPDLENIQVLKKIMTDRYMGYPTDFNSLLRTIHELANSIPAVNSKLVRIAFGL